MDMEALKSDYCAGVLSIQKVADKHGVSKTTLIDWAKKYGWVRKKQVKKNRPKIRPKNPTKMQNGRMDGRKKNARKTSSDADYEDDDVADDSDENSANSPETKRIPGRPFTAHNTASLKHGAYARRLLLSDDVTIDTLNTKLRDELFLVRAGNMLAVTNIGKWTAQMEDATPEEQKNLREQIAAAEKGIMRNIARIESLERSLGALAIMAVTPAKIVADTAYKEAVTAKLTAENQGITTPLTEAIDELQSLNKGGKP